jgi:hypothetical protein
LAIWRSGPSTFGDKIGVSFARIACLERFGYAF